MRVSYWNALSVWLPRILHFISAPVEEAVFTLVPPCPNHIASFVPALDKYLTLMAQTIHHGCTVWKFTWRPYISPLWDIVETGFFVIDEANPTFAEYLLITEQCASHWRSVLCIKWRRVQSSGHTWKCKGNLEYSARNSCWHFICSRV